MYPSPVWVLAITVTTIALLNAIGAIAAYACRFSPQPTPITTASRFTVAALWDSIKTRYPRFAAVPAGMLLMPLLPLLLAALADQPSSGLAIYFSLLAVVGLGASYGYPFHEVTDSGERRSLRFTVDIVGLATHLLLHLGITSGTISHFPQVCLVVALIGHLGLLLGLTYGIESLLSPLAPASATRERELVGKQQVLRYRAICLCIMTGLGALLVDATARKWIPELHLAHTIIPLVFLLSMVKLFNAKGAGLEKKRA